jgi:hypothetical protein
LKCSGFPDCQFSQLTRKRRADFDTAGFLLKPLVEEFAGK